MKTILCSFFFLVFTLSCSDKKKYVEKIDIEFEIINNDIFTHFPGGLDYIDKYIAWFEPFTTDHFIHVLDAQSGEELGVMGKKGQGPLEFISPMTSDIVFNNELFVIDVNGKNSGYLSIDSLLAGKEPLVLSSEKDSLIRLIGYNTRLENDLYIGPNQDELDKTYPYISYSNEVKSFFGNYPIKDEQYRFSSSFAYNTNNKILVNACNKMKYISAHKIKNNKFELLWEIRVPHNYSNSDKTIVLDDKKIGVRELCLTKDYIVTVERNYETDATDESTVGRDADKLPKTLFVYDYKGNLLKILKSKFSFIRIAGDINTNNVYAIVPNPDFMLIKLTI